MKKVVVSCLVVLLLCGLCIGGSLFVYNSLKNGDYSKLGFLASLSGKGEDLGIKFTEIDSQKFLETNSLIATNVCPTGETCNVAGPTFLGTKSVDTTISNSEGTALINDWISQSKNAPFSSAQMRVNANGSVDFSGTVDLSRLKNFGTATKVPAEIMDAAIKFVGALGESFPISASGTASIKNNVVTADFTSIKVGFLPVPSSILNGQKVAINNFIEDRLSNVEGMSIEELSFADGKTTFKGTMPETIVYSK
jgi:hypothetical protein